MTDNGERRLKPAEVELALRRAAELSARRQEASEAEPVSEEMLVQVAAAVGIPEADVRRALTDLRSVRPVEPDSLAKKLYGPARLRAAREIPQPPATVQGELESLLRLKQGLKLRHKTGVSSTWDAGDVLGTVRRALDFSEDRALLKVQSVELRVREAGGSRTEAHLTADASNQRGEYLSLGGILGATLALPAAIAGVYDPLYFLLVPPALAAPGLGFKLAYKKTCAEVRRALDLVLDAAEKTPPDQGTPRGEDASAMSRIRDLNPIPRFTPRSRE
jgi:hypothetical protein